MTDRTYGTRLPGLPKETPAGKLIVVEGADGSGRTTEVALLKEIRPLLPRFPTMQSLIHDQ